MADQLQTARRHTDNSRECSCSFTTLINQLSTLNLLRSQIATSHVARPHQAVNGRVIACRDSPRFPDRNNPSTLGQAGCSNGSRKLTTRHALCVRKRSTVQLSVCFRMCRSFPCGYFSNFGSLGSIASHGCRRTSKFRAAVVERYKVEPRFLVRNRSSKQSRTAFRTKTATVAHHFARCPKYFAVR